MKLNSQLSKASIFYILAPTLLYWWWESHAQGNIRIDLILIYPFLFVIYLTLLWRGFRYYAILIATVLMLMNFLFFIFSYDVFGKYPG